MASMEEKNESLVLKRFDALFNKRDVMEKITTASSNKIETDPRFAAFTWW